MKNRAIMKAVTGVCVVAIAGGGLSSVAWAKPDKPLNAAQADSGTGCLVRDADGAYHYDETCEWHTVVKLDKNGNLKFFSYQDHGQLPEDAPHPSSASKNSGDWPGCADGFSEVTTPSGEYSSTCSTRN